jgi:hypothetical protein
MVTLAQAGTKGRRCFFAPNSNVVLAVHACIAGPLNLVVHIYCRTVHIFPARLDTTRVVATITIYQFRVRATYMFQLDFFRNWVTTTV